MRNRFLKSEFIWIDSLLAHPIIEHQIPSGFETGLATRFLPLPDPVGTHFVKRPATAGRPVRTIIFRRCHPLS